MTKAILKSLKPKTCANIMNLIQSVLVIKDKREAAAIQKLIDTNGYAEICVCSSKGKERLVNLIDDDFYCGASTRLNGKVLFRFRCYKLEEIPNYGLARHSEIMMEELLKKSCLTREELDKYVLHKEYEDDYIYAIYISNLNTFDEPKELNEFWICRDTYGKPTGERSEDTYLDTLAKAPRNWCYIFLD